MNISCSDIVKKLKRAFPNLKELISVNKQLDATFVSSNYFTSFLENDNITYVYQEKDDELKETVSGFSSQLLEYYQKLLENDSQKKFFLPSESLIDKKLSTEFLNQFKDFSFSIQKTLHNEEEELDSEILEEEEEQESTELSLVSLNSELENKVKQELSYLKEKEEECLMYQKVFKSDDVTQYLILRLLTALHETRHTLTSRLDHLENHISMNADEIISQVTENVKELVENNLQSIKQVIKRKKIKLPLRSYMSYEDFQIIYQYAGMFFDRKKHVRMIQLRIIYFLLYFLGLRVGEVKYFTKEMLLEALDTAEFSLVLPKTQTPILRVLPEVAMKEFSEVLRTEIFQLFDMRGYIYLGATKPNSLEVANRANFANFVNTDLENIHLKKNIKLYTSHSFRITYITNLRSSGIPFEEIAEIIGHKYVSSTYGYNRYLSTSKEKREIINTSFKKSMN